MMLFIGIDLGVLLYVRRGKWVILEYTLHFLVHCSSGCGRFSAGLVNWISTVFRVKSGAHLKASHIKASVQNETGRERRSILCSDETRASLGRPDCNYLPLEFSQDKH